MESASAAGRQPPKRSLVIAHYIAYPVVLGPILWRIYEEPGIAGESWMPLTIAVAYFLVSAMEAHAFLEPTYDGWDAFADMVELAILMVFSMTVGLFTLPGGAALPAQAPVESALLFFLLGAIFCVPESQRLLRGGKQEIRQDSRLDFLAVFGVWAAWTTAALIAVQVQDGAPNFTRASEAVGFVFLVLVLLGYLAVIFDRSGKTDRWEALRGLRSASQHESIGVAHLAIVLVLALNVIVSLV